MSRPPYDRWREFECTKCGYEWEVEGEHELWHWWAFDEDDLYCPECGHEGRWADSMDAVTERRLRQMAQKWTSESTTPS